MDGTYKYGSFQDNEKELERLLRQAQVALNFEMNILKESGLEKGMKVIDVGCGPGITAASIAGIVQPSTVLGIDANEKLLEVANLYKQKQNIQNLDFKLQNVYELSLKEKDFNFAYCRFLFQHLTDPERALKQISSVILDKGKIVIADVDDQFLSLYPENKSFELIKEHACICQAKNGGDRFVGRKLAVYAKNIGLKNIKIKTATITSLDIGLSNFLRLTMDFKAEQIPDESIPRHKIESALKEIHSLSQQKYIGIICVIVMIAEK